MRATARGPGNRGPNATIGHLGECELRRWSADRGVTLGLIPDSFYDIPAQDHPDAVVLDVDDSPLAAREGQMVSIKATAVRQADGSSTRRGRLHVRKRAHDWLLDRDGLYGIVLYHRGALQWEDGDPVETTWVCHRLVPAAVVDEALGTWTTTGSLVQVARVSWARLVDPSTVDTLDGDRP